MIRELPKKPPVAVLTAAAEVIEGGAKVAGDRYVPHAHSLYTKQANKARLRDDTELLALSEAIFEWGIAVRGQLPLAQLCEIFHEPPDASGPYLSVISLGLTLVPEGSMRGDSLNTNLFLGLNKRSSWPFRLKETLNGHPVHSPSDELIGSAAELHSKLHPRMLRAIHAEIASGDVWSQVVRSLKLLKVWSSDG